MLYLLIKIKAEAMQGRCLVKDEGTELFLSRVFYQSAAGLRLVLCCRQTGQFLYSTLQEMWYLSFLEALLHGKCNASEKIFQDELRNI